MMEGKVRYRGCVITIVRYGIYVTLNQGDDCMEAEVSPSVSSPGSLGILDPRTPAYVDG